jgi:hypothetical protein
MSMSSMSEQPCSAMSSIVQVYPDPIHGLCHTSSGRDVEQEWRRVAPLHRRGETLCPKSGRSIWAAFLFSLVLHSLDLCGRQGR